MSTNSLTDNKRALGPYLSPLAAWAFSIGASVGWGSLVVTANTYLAQAGPGGSVVGLLIGMALMLVICRNFSFLACRYPDAGGVYTYVKNVFGYDRAFLVFWFLSLTYISMFWANASSLPLFARYFLGGVFRFGYLYTVFGFEVYLGEALLTLAAILLVTLLCVKSRQATARAMTALSLTFFAGITVCFFAALFHRPAPAEPAFIPEKSALKQIVKIALISPWAFIGFENITHSVEEFNFKKEKLHTILVVSVISATALYVFVTLLSVTCYPADCGGWLEYIRNLDRYDGIEGLPAFYAAYRYLGSFGVAVLMLSLLALVITSLIANLHTISRLFCATARDGILPERFSQLNEKRVPHKAMLLVAALSLPIAFLGRTAISWIVDVTTIGATMLYAFVSAAAWKVARQEKNRWVSVTGCAGFAIMLAFAFYLLLPNLFSNDMLETETYILFMVWTVAGFFYFRWIIAKDHARRFGKAIIVWISLLALVVLMAMIWSERADEQVTVSAIQAVQDYFHGHNAAVDEQTFIQEQLDRIHLGGVTHTVIVIGLFGLALGGMLFNHVSMRKWEAQTARERDQARSAAYTDPLTRVKNKNAFTDRETEMDRAIQQKTAEPFGVVVCDLNGLKHINDTLGHKAGDEYIRKACQMICVNYKHSPVFRIGGDEFAVLLRGQDYENRQEIFDSVNRAVEQNLKDGSAVFSLGMSEFIPEKDSRFHSVFVRADEMMYQRKKELKAMGAVSRD